MTNHDDANGAEEVLDTIEDTAESAAHAAADAADEAAHAAADAAEDAGEKIDEEMKGAGSPFAEIHDLVGEIVDGVRSFAPAAVARHPRLDFVETPVAYLLVYDLPGLARGDISVTTEGDEVVVSGERTRPDFGEGVSVRRSERPHGAFRRATRVPADVRLDEIRAKLEDGVLTVTLPRRVEAEGRKVDIEG